MELGAVNALDERQADIHVFGLFYEIRLLLRSIWKEMRYGSAKKPSQKQVYLTELL